MSRSRSSGPSSSDYRSPTTPSNDLRHFDDAHSIPLDVSIEDDPNEYALEEDDDEEEDVDEGHDLPMSDSKRSYDSCRSGQSYTTKASALSPHTKARHGCHEAHQVLPKRSDFGDYFPDGGWGWVVCGAAFVVHFLCLGIHLAGGTLIDEVSSQYQVPHSTSVWLSSLSYGISLLCCPLVVAIGRRRSPRLLAVVGTMVAALGCLFMSFSGQLHQLLVASAGVLGPGSGLALSSGGVVLGRYFHKRRECAEMLVLCGGGVGMAVVSVFLKQIYRSLSWMRGTQVLAAVMLPAVAASLLFRSVTLYHPRRKAIMHIKHLARSRKQQRDFENKPPYLDFSPLRMRSVQILMLSTATTSAGNYVPFILLPHEAKKSGLGDQSITLLMVFLGVAFAFGSLLFGLLVLRSSLRCLIAKQYLCQITALGCGLTALLFTMAEGFRAFALFVWAYGLFCGGYYYTIKIFTCEQVTLKLSERCMGYIMFAQAVPVIFGSPISQSLSESTPSAAGRAGFIFAGACMVVGAGLLFLAPWAARHRSNYDSIRKAHLQTKTLEDDHVLGGMEVSDDVGSVVACGAAAAAAADEPTYATLGVTGLAGLPVPASSAALRTWSSAHYASDVDKWKAWATLFGAPPPPLSNPPVAAGPNDRLCDIEAIADIGVMSATDKVTEFLLHSQSMLQNFSHVHRIDLPNVRLEINDEYTRSGGRSWSSDGRPHAIKDLTLHATIGRAPVAGASPRRRCSGSTGDGPMPRMKHSHSQENKFGHTRDTLTRVPSIDGHLMMNSITAGPRTSLRSRDSSCDREMDEVQNGEEAVTEKCEKTTTV